MTRHDGLPIADRPVQIACTLPAARIPDRLGEWAALRSQATATEPIAGGVRMALPAERAPAARDLAMREQCCCSFLEIDVGIDGDRCLIDITSSHPDAGSVISALVGHAD